jgi:hypothetical protein
MGLFFDPHHVFAGHVDNDLQQYDSHHAHLGGSELHGDTGYHYDHQHQIFATTEHRADGSQIDFDHSHHMLGTTEHHGGIAYHFDGSHHLTGTEQHIGGQTYSFDPAHQITGIHDDHGMNALQADLSSAFRRLF